MKYVKRPKLRIVERLEDIPAFASEDAERDWWASHDLSEELYKQLEIAPPRKGTQLYRLRVSTRTPGR